MLNRILHEALKREGLQNESESDIKSEESILMKQKQPKDHAKMMNSIPKNMQTRKKNVEIESKLNSVYNRLV